ncbi:iron-sulfur cluster assembly accessory protein [Salinibacillus xinjiangensis]|uniref:Iron-sulfur cluster assembly accessory protein n=1 Tax=Salinibacillus xinjiangensis TaxID=1229268 RepID=A0A6G1X2F0_9BACI|nr:iron-sulfur cluster assembly accessory protein [Salinibacillus xinjiangensis]MRG85114.1 iron-sulfur cluster assembly accessory protein [Salinibacillus xinjiangensis]
MKVKMNKNAGKELKRMLATDEAKGKMIRVSVTHIHGDHAHYEIDYDTPTEHDEIVKTDKDVDVLLDTREAEWLDGIWVQFFHVPKPEFVVTNPTIDKGHHHHH